MNFHIVISKGEDGWLIGECPALPGCMTQGKDELELMKNMREAIRAWLLAADEAAIEQIHPRPEMKLLALT